MVKVSIIKVNFKHLYVYLLNLFLAISCLYGANISSCPYTVTSNSILTQDISSSGATCITMGANNIVLDCQGHSITGVRTNYGISNPNRDNVIIKNCNVLNFSMAVNIGSGSQNVTLTNMNFSLNSDVGLGVYSQDSSYNNIRSYNNVNHGIYVSDDSNNFYNIYTYYNSKDGIRLSGTILNSFDNVHTYNNTENGFYLSISHYNTISDLTSYSNKYGIWISSSQNNTIVNSYFYGNTLDDIRFYLATAVQPVFNKLYSNIIDNSCKIGGLTYVNYLNNSYVGNDYGNESCFNGGDCLQGGIICDYFKYSTLPYTPSPSSTNTRILFPFGEYKIFFITFLGIVLYIVAS